MQEIEISGDRSVPLDHPERQRFNAMFDWMKKGGAQFPKLKLRYYTEDYRGVHAATQIEKGETILYVPLSQLLTLDMAMQSPIGSLMAARNFRQRLLPNTLSSQHLSWRRRGSPAHPSINTSIFCLKASLISLFSTQRRKETGSLVHPSSNRSQTKLRIFRLITRRFARKFPSTSSSL